MPSSAIYGAIAARGIDMEDFIMARGIVFASHAKEERDSASLWLTNRDRKLAPKQGVAWCNRCDACLVADGQKCRNCGLRNGTRRHKR